MNMQSRILLSVLEAGPKANTLKAIQAQESREAADNKGRSSTTCGLARGARQPTSSSRPSTRR
jgi:hypothetical protein